MVKTRVRHLAVFATSALLFTAGSARAQSARTSAPGPAPHAAASAGLADAAEKADWTTVRALVNLAAGAGSSPPKQAVGVNAMQADGMTALHWAVYHDSQPIVSLLVTAHASVSAKNRYGVTPLSLACTNGNAVIVDLLLKAGANPNESLPGGETPLMTAARTGKLAVVKTLLSRGATVDAKDERRGQTALMWAAAEGHASVVHALVDAGADFRMRLSSGFTPLLFAVREGRIDVVRTLLEAGADVNEMIPVDSARRRGYGGGVPPAGATPLLIAVKNAHFDLASALLDAGANPNVDATGYTVLHLIAVVRNPGVGDNNPAPEGSGTMTSLELVKKLVARGANVNARMTKKPNLNNTRLNEMGATPFFLAALTADVELMKALTASGADTALKNVDNSTPLMAAAGLATRSPGEDAGTEIEVLAAVQLLLDLGADINAVDNNGETAMHSAAYRNLPKVVRFLAAKGAKIEIWNKPDKFDWTPLQIAAGYRFGNFKPSPDTEAAIREVMIAAGVTPPKGVTGRNR